MTTVKGMIMTKRRTRVSTAVNLLIMPAIALTLTGCFEDEVEAKKYNSVQECANDPQNTIEGCTQAFAEAKSIHETSAPNFQSLQDCEEEFGAGQCGASPASSPVASANPVSQAATPAPQTVVVHENNGFSPLLMYWMMTHGSSGGGTTNNYHSAAPVYAGAHGGYYNQSGRRFDFDSTGRTSAPKESFNRSSVAATPRTTYGQSTGKSFTGGSSGSVAKTVATPSVRGGFGSTASKISGGRSSGGGRSFSGGRSFGG